MKILRQLEWTQRATKKATTAPLKRDSASPPWKTPRIYYYCHLMSTKGFPPIKTSTNQENAGTKCLYPTCHALAMTRRVKDRLLQQRGLCFPSARCGRRTHHLSQSFRPWRKKPFVRHVWPLETIAKVTYTGPTTIRDVVADVQGAPPLRLTTHGVASRGLRTYQVLTIPSKLARRCRVWSRLPNHAPPTGEDIYFC